MTSFFGYINNAVIKLLTYFNSHMLIDWPNKGHHSYLIYALHIIVKSDMSILFPVFLFIVLFIYTLQFNCQPMLLLKTHYGFHELFLTYLLGVTPNLYSVTIVTCKWCCLLSMPFFLLLYTWLYVFKKATYLLGVAPKHNCSQCSCTCKKHLRRSSPPDNFLLCVFLSPILAPSIFGGFVNNMYGTWKSIIKLSINI